MACPDTAHPQENCQPRDKNTSRTNTKWTSDLRNSHSLMTPATMLKQQGCRENDQKTGGISTSPLVFCLQSKMQYHKRQTFSKECHTQVNILSETNIGSVRRIKWNIFTLCYNTIILFTMVIASTVSTVTCSVLEFCFEVFKKKIISPFPFDLPVIVRFKGPIL